MIEDVQIVLESAHPGAIFSSSVPGRKPMSSPTGTVTRVSDDLGVELGSRTWVSLRPASAAFSGPGLAQQGDEVDFRVHEQIHGEILLRLRAG